MNTARRLGGLLLVSTFSLALLAGAGCGGDGRTGPGNDGGRDAAADGPSDDVPADGPGGEDGPGTKDGPGGNDVPPADLTGDVPSPPPDGMTADIPPSGPCDPLDQSTCDPEEACGVVQGAVNCYPAGKGGAGAECDGSQMNGGCQRGFVCATPPLGGDPQCRTICNPQAPACPAMEACSGFLPGFNPQRERLCVPVVECDIFSQKPCGAGQKCDVSPNSSTGAECYLDGNIAEGQNCGGGSCQAGLVCATFNGSTVCRALCDPTDKMRRTCDTGECFEFDQYPGIGFCATP